MKLGSIPEKKKNGACEGQRQGGVQNMEFPYIDISHWEGFNIYIIFIDLGYVKLKFSCYVFQFLLATLSNQ